MSLKDLQDLNVIAKNRDKSRSYFIPFSKEDRTLTYDRGQSERFQLLNGAWKFLFLNHPQESPEGFMKENCNVDEWDLVHVPHHWQLEGYDKPHYTNKNYPFPVDPPKVPTDNPTGLYRREFYIPERWGEKQILLRFEGVDNSFHLWVNGEEVGYSEGGRVPAEFNITKFIRQGVNTVTLRVYKWSKSSYLEDQDMWWLSGVFRDVYLLARPNVHVRDKFVRTILDVFRK